MNKKVSCNDNQDLFPHMKKTFHTYSFDKNENNSDWAKNQLGLMKAM